MSKQQHTRGPWKSRHKDYAIWDGNGCRWVVVTAPKRGEIARFKKDADAILASSAPELLEALINLEAAYSKYINWQAPGRFDRNPQLTAPPALQARAAIAKARGE